jgi:hypothetical protein
MTVGRPPKALDGLQTIALNRVAEAAEELAAAEAAAEAARIKWRARMFSASRAGVPHYRVAVAGKIKEDWYRVIRATHGYAATLEQGQHAA